MIGPAALFVTTMSLAGPMLPSLVPGPDSATFDLVFGLWPDRALRPRRHRCHAG